MADYSIFLNKFYIGGAATTIAEKRWILSGISFGAEFCTGAYFHFKFLFQNYSKVNWCTIPSFRDAVEDGQKKIR